MSRIGNAIIDLPSGVDCSVDAKNRVTVKGAKGTLDYTLPPGITLAVEDGVVSLSRANDARDTKALHGLARSLVANMVIGVSEGYRRQLTMVGVGYRASLKGKAIELLVGYSHPVEIEAPDGITFEVPDPTTIVITGIDKQAVGQIAANIRRVRPPEPYKGKGIRYSDEVVRRKAGKAGVTA